MDLESAIRTQGWAAQSVHDRLPKFVYSIGLHDKMLPELIVFGLPVSLGKEVINLTAHICIERAGSRQAVSAKRATLIELPSWPRPFWLVPAIREQVAQYAVDAVARSRSQTEFLQIVWSDVAGRFPWEPGAQAFEDQPALYEKPFVG